MRHFLIAVVALALCGLAAAEEPEDPYLWLEEVEGEKALEWVKERSAKDTADPRGGAGLTARSTRSSSRSTTRAIGFRLW